MLNASTAYRKKLLEDSKVFYQRVVITLTDNTELTLDNTKLWKGGLSFDEAVSSDGTFEVGAAIINSCSFTINNIDESYSQYDFSLARVVVSVGLEVSEGNIEYLQKGVYIVDDTSYNGSLIRLSCLDKMSLFDRVYDTQLAFPATLAQIVNDACLKCGVTLNANSTNFPHRTYSVAEKPSSEDTTYREMIAYCAQIAGCYAKVNNLGYLTFGWYNQSLIQTTPTLRERMSDIANFIFNDYKLYSWQGLITSAFINADGLPSTGIVNFSGIFSHNVCMDDVVITGVQVAYHVPGENTDGKVTTGTDGYVISIEDNALIQSAAQATQVAGWLGSQLVGFRYRVGSANHLGDPTIEGGDVGFLVDRKGNVFPVIVSGTTFRPGATQNTRSSGATPARNSAERFSATTKNYVKLKEIIKEVDDYYQNGLDELSEALDSKGGLYTTIQTAAGGGNTYYMHDQPDLEDSMIVWKMTDEAWGVSTDGGTTWNGGMTINGDVIARYLSADGVNANWMRTGIITDRNALNYWNLDTGAFSLQGVATDQDIQDAVDALEVDLQTQIDSKINTFYQSADPSTGWTSDERTAHIGDLWYDTDTSVTYRWNGTTWQEQEVPDAISSAIESKSTIFYGSTSGTYTGVTTGDYLVDSSSGKTYRWNGSSWVVQTDYASAISSAISSLRSDLESQIEDGKIETFYQSADPSTSWTTAQKSAHTGDLWYKTSDGSTWRWSGSAWQEQSVPDEVFDAIDGKSTIFYGTTSGTYTGVQTGDYLVDSTTGSTYRWSGSAWVKQTDYATAISNYDTSLNQQAVFNKLTNNSQNEGVYLSNSHLYINASMIKTGSMDASLIKAGILKSQDSNTNFYVNMLTGSATLKDVTLTGASRFGYHPYIGNGKISLTNDTYGVDSISISDGKIDFYGLDEKNCGFVRAGDSILYANHNGLRLNSGDYNHIVLEAPYLWQGVNSGYKKILVEDDLSSYVTITALNNHIDDMNNNILPQYATRSWVQSQGYLTGHQSLSGYATQSWVNNQGFVKWSALDLSGYAKKADLNDYVLTSTAQVGGLFTAIVETRGAHTNMLLDELTWWYGENEFTGRTGNYTIDGHTYSFRRGVLVGYT